MTLFLHRSKFYHSKGHEDGFKVKIIVKKICFMICFSFSSCQQGERDQANHLFLAKKLLLCQSDISTSSRS